jgi:serine/threonine-protein kinase
MFKNAIAIGTTIFLGLAGSVEAQPIGVATVIDPPSNIRVQPNGKVICSVNSVRNINVFDYRNGWYKTDFCGRIGFIHQSQLSFDRQPPQNPTRRTAIVIDPPTNIRVQPNGKIICSLKTRIRINVYEYNNGWYITDVCGGTGYIHESQLRF